MGVKSKHTKAIFLLLLSALPVFAVIAFLLQQQVTRLAMERRLSQKELTVLTLSKSDFTWHEEGREISINGHLFDVKKIEQTETGLFKVTGIYDWQEDELYRHLENALEDEDNDPNNKRKAFIKWLTSGYDRVEAAHQHTDFRIIKNKHCLLQTSFLHKSFLEIELPPPQTLL